MGILSNHFVDIILTILIISWIGYSIAVLIYLNKLSKKYLVPVNRDEMISSKKLKSAKDLIKQYENTDTLNILVLSGGGLRGLVPLEVLSHLEKKTGKKTGELFDFIAGSSTGAITAAGICVGDENGGYKFSASEIFTQYEANAHKIFSSPWYHQWLTCFGLFAPRYLPDNKLKVIEYYTSDLTIGELKGNLLIPVYDIDKNNLKIIKNWYTSHDHVSHDNFLAKDLVHGASNPPMIFTPIAFASNDKKNVFIDPAVLLNNPLLHIFLHVRALFPHKKLNILLLGNGPVSEDKYNYKTMFSFGLYGMYQYLYSAPALGSKLYIEFMHEYLTETQKFNEQVSFYRIDSDSLDKLSPVSISEKNLKNIRLFAEKMLHNNLHKINELAEVFMKHKFVEKHKHDK